MKRIILTLFIFSFIYAQEENVDITTDTSAVIDSTDLNVEAIDNSGLDFGYKDYKWGSAISNLPSMENFTAAQVNSDQSFALLTGTLGLDSVDVNYVFSDSGFWKVEIDFALSADEMDDNINTFLRLENNISEIYGNPYSTEQTLNGPSNSYNNFLNIKYSRSFYRSSWNVSPVKILLILNSLVQQPQTDNSILEGKLSFMKLVYYNPDYMISTNGQSQEQVFPSIYDIY
jgi:hypothetical protein